MGVYIKGVVIKMAEQQGALDAKGVEFIANYRAIADKLRKLETVVVPSYYNFQAFYEETRF